MSMRPTFQSYILHSVLSDPAKCLAYSKFIKVWNEPLLNRGKSSQRAPDVIGPFMHSFPTPPKHLIYVLGSSGSKINSLYPKIQEWRT